MKYTILLFGLLWITGCSSTPQPEEKCTTKVLTYDEMKQTKSITYKEEIPQKILDEESQQQAAEKERKYLFDDTSVGSSVETDSGAFLNQEKRQYDIKREVLNIKR